MIPDLRERRFAEFDRGPELTSDGYFVITPERPECSAWAADQTITPWDTARSALGVQ
jgi:hypothetical protein